MTIETGRWISPEDYLTKQRVAVLGTKAATKLFGEIPPDGETIAINGLQFQVIGLLKTKTQISNYNTPDNECVFIPLSTASLLRDIKYPSDIVWMPANPLFRKQAVGTCERCWRGCIISRQRTNARWRWSYLTNS